MSVLAIAGRPIAALDDDSLPAGEALIDRLGRGDSPPLVNFIEIFARRVTGARAPQVNPIGVLPLAALPADALLVDAQETLLLSDRDWCGWPSDSKRPHQTALPVLIDPGDLTTRGPIFPEEARRSQTTGGAARVILTPALAAFLRTHAIDASRIVSFFGEEAGFSSDHVINFEAIVKSTAREGDVLTIYFDTAQSLLDSPAQSAKFTGSGASGGDAHLKDRYLPEVYGHFYNAEPVLCVAAVRDYRMNIGDIDGYDAIKDKLVPLQWDGRAFDDYAAYYLALEEDPPEPGFYTLGPDSHFGLGDDPVGIITCDGRGSTLFGGFDARTRAILRFKLGGGKPLGLTFDEATFSLIPDDEIGLYLDGSVDYTKEEIANALLAPYLAWIDVDPAGLVGVARAVDPDGGPPVDTLTSDDILDGWRLAPLDNPVRVSQEVTYARNWRPMLPNEIADPAEQPLVSVDEWNRAQRTEEIALAGDDVVLIPHPSAKPGPRLRGYFTTKDGAQAAADNIFATFGKRLNLASIPVLLARATSMRRGRRIAIEDDEITGGATKNMTIIGIEPSSSRFVTVLIGIMSEDFEG